MAPGKEGKDLCLRGMGLYGDDLMGPLLGFVLTSRVLSYCQLPIAPSEKVAEKRRSAYTSKEGPRGGGGPVGAASSPTSSCPHVVFLAPWGLLPLSWAQAPIRRDVWLSMKWGGKAMTGFYSLFQPNSHTLGLRH